MYEAILGAAEDEVGKLDTAMLNLLSEKGEMTDEARQTLDAFSRQSVRELNISNVRIAQSYAQALSDRCNLVNTAMAYSARSAFTGAVNEVYSTMQRGDVLAEMNAGAAAVVSGTESLNEAVRNTIRRLAAKGLPGFVDKAGREWSPEAYVKMDMRSTMGNTARAAQDARCDAYGISLIEVSSHMGARPKCAPYQGRIFSRDGTSGTTHDLDGNTLAYIPLSETSYGEPDGLFGINCGHQQYPFIPGVSLKTYYPYDEEQNAAVYKEMQQQRTMERRIRADKRECMMLQAAGDKEGLQKAAQRLRADKDKYIEFSRSKGLGLHNENTQVYGYDRSKSMKTVWAEDAERGQHYKTRLSESADVKVSKLGKSVNCYSSKNSTNKFYVSENCSIHKPKQLQDIDTTISETLDVMGLRDTENLPEIFIMSDTEMGTGNVGSYNPIKNQMFLHEGLFKDKATRATLQADGVFPDSKISTSVHEMIHWQDAEKFRRSGGAFSSDDVYKEFCRQLDNDSKKILDKAGVTAYNVSNISVYAEKMYNESDFNEVYTEYRTHKLLERRAQK